MSGYYAKPKVNRIFNCGKAHISLGKGEKWDFDIRDDGMCIISRKTVALEITPVEAELYFDLYRSYNNG